MLFRSDPFRELDRLADQLASGVRTPRLMPMDAYRSGDHFVLHFDLPGVDPASVDLSIDDSVLTVRASRPGRTLEDVQPLVNERPMGEFSRQLTLGSALDAARTTATYDAGVLTVTIPVAETAKPRKIQVSSSEGPHVIDADASREQSAVGSAG